MNPKLHHINRGVRLNRRSITAGFLRLGLMVVMLSGFGSYAAIFEVQDKNGVIIVSTPGYRLEITKEGFRYGIASNDGVVVTPPHRTSGLSFGGGQAVSTVLVSSDSRLVVVQVMNDKGKRAEVVIEPAKNHIRFGITQSETNEMIARIGGISPAFGLGDHAAIGRGPKTDVTGFSSSEFRAQEAPGERRLISNFIISPARGIALVNMERGLKIVRVLTNETAQGVVAAREMPALYYFIGSPQEIYSAYLVARNREGYQVYKPKYEFFGVGWEAFGALGWRTNEKTVTENVERYLSLGYPLEWMVVGSGFWPNEETNLCATTSFGLWDKVRYPDPERFIKHFKDRGLKFFLGLRISFIENGPYSKEGLAKGYFLTENGRAKSWTLGFPKSPAYLLDCSNPEAVKWYIRLCRKWLDAGVDGFKEDLFGYRHVSMRDGSIDLVNQALMEQGSYVMGRNGYLGSAADIHRIEDFNFDQNQDRGPVNILAFAYSGFAYPYPDTVGGTFGDHRPIPPAQDSKVHTYMMRAAQFSSVTPCMAVGMGPWNFGEQVGKVMLQAAQLHAQLHPYIYSAAVDAFETGFPAVMTPLPLAFPDDPDVYKRENSQVRGYQWLLGPSLLACPLYGNDYATATTRDVYLPAGNWMDFDTGEMRTGPKLLKSFPLPIGKTPLFIGGKGVLVLRDLPGQSLKAVVYPIANAGSTYRFTNRDGVTRTAIVNDNHGWNPDTLKITDTTENRQVEFTCEPSTGAIRFSLQPGHDYRLSGGEKANDVTK